MAQIKKQDTIVSMHCDDGEDFFPAVDVKGQSLLYHSAVMAQFGCDLKQAENALGFAFAGAQSCFWDISAPEICTRILGDEAEIEQVGRSGGWLIVRGISSPLQFEDTLNEWDDATLAKWVAFEDAILAEIKAICSEENLLGAIKENEWWKKGSEAYNFCRDGKGVQLSVPDLKQRAIEAGFGAVVRT